MSNIPADDVSRFAALFRGYEHAYGTYVVRTVDETGKHKGDAVTHKGQATDTDYANHLSGRKGLGIIPLLQDNTVAFGALDYDNKRMDHARAWASIVSNNLPLVLCRSKSGGGHFYCFTTEPVPVDLMQACLDAWRAVLGMSAKTELFPKQRDRQGDTDYGNWINLPYYDAVSTTRFAYTGGPGEEPVAATLPQFLDLAEGRRVDAEWMREWLRAADTTTAQFHEGPPCLVTIQKRGGFAHGTKKDGMFEVGVFLKKAFPDDWETQMDEYNRSMAGLTSTEVAELIKSLKKKDYAYRCKKPHLADVCNRRLCRQRMFGIGEGPNDGHAREVEFSALTCYTSAHGDEPVWAMEVNGRRIQVTSAQLYSRDDFNRACLAQARMIPVHMSPQKWLKMVSEMAVAADVVPMPEDAGPLGQVWVAVQAFVSENVTAETWEEMARGIARLHEGRVYFRSPDLFRYLKTRGISYKNEQQVWGLLRDKGGETKFVNPKGKGMNLWHLPAPAAPATYEPAPAAPDQSEVF